MTKMSDQELFQRCRKFGAMALSARRKFTGLLPEVFRRRLFEKKGFSSIYMFAEKLAGMTYEQVKDVLNLEKSYADKPVLHAALVSGEVSVSKLRRVASIATVANQDELFGIVKSFSNRAVETFVRDVKREKAEASWVGENENVNSFQKPLFDPKSPHVRAERAGLKLDSDVEKELFEMQEKGIDINQFLRAALETRREKIEEKKEKIAKEQALKEGNTANNPRTSKKVNPSESPFVNSSTSPSRHIPATVKRIIREEHGTKCSYPGCMKDARVLHHTQRFALARVHDPRFIAPLCSAHHEIAHKIDVKFTKRSTPEILTQLT